MARTKRDRRTYSAGEWGRNRVRVFPDPKTGLYQIEWRENGRRLTRSLKHRDWRRAKRQADEAAAGFAGPEVNGRREAETEPLTLGTLFDIYGEEVTPTKGETARMHDRAGTAMFLGFFGRDRRPETLSRRDWDRFIRERRAGRIGPRGKPVADQTIGGDLTFLMAVLNWAARSRDEHGRLLLDRNPLKGLRKPVEKNPVRVVVTDEEYRAMLGVSRQVGWRFHVALVLAHETGHRIGAIRNLKWSDVDLDGETIRWRGEHEKTGYEHRTPLSAPALAVLRRAWRRSPGVEGAPVLPSSKDPAVSVNAWMTRVWWKRAEQLAGMERKHRRGWHSLRRKFASDLMDQPLKVSASLAAGGTPRRCSPATSSPTRDSFGRLWKPAAGRAARISLGGNQSARIRPAKSRNAKDRNR